jgi:Cu(I)/Ag(I) efflux system membrane fusion protein
MKNSLIVLLLVFTFVSCSSSKQGSSNNQFQIDTTKLSAGETFYQCPMHPEVLSKQSGQCPKCGMQLEKITKR